MYYLASWETDHSLHSQGGKKLLHVIDLFTDGGKKAAASFSPLALFLLSVMLPREINRTTVAGKLCLSFPRSE